MVDVLERTDVLEVTILEVSEVLDVIEVFVATGATGRLGLRKVVTATQAEIIPVSAPMMPMMMLIFAYLGSMFLGRELEAGRFMRLYSIKHAISSLG